MAERPVAIVCVGMAGSGKTTFMQRINSYLHTQKTPPYVMNLDPAVRNVPFECNIDIRDSVNYKEVMKQYHLGPNGGILTSLNLFVTKIDQIMNLLEKRTKPDPQQPNVKPIKHIIIDTPGQIEVFVWSASGAILLDALASSFPTVIAYVIDTPRTSSTSTFMSNMLYACSILYKTKVPMILVFNKTDVHDAAFATEWMTNFDAFQSALRAEEEQGNFAEGGSGYMSSFLHSMSLVLEEFYRHLNVVGVSSMTGHGVTEFFDAVKAKEAEYERVYRPALEKMQAEKEKNKTERQGKELEKLLAGMNVQSGKKAAKKQEEGEGEGSGEKEEETLSDLEAQMDSDVEAEMVEPDEDEDRDEGGGEDDGLARRYRQALQDTGGGSMEEAESFARYLNASAQR